MTETQLTRRGQIVTALIACAATLSALSCLTVGAIWAGMQMPHPNGWALVVLLIGLASVGVVWLIDITPAVDTTDEALRDELATARSKRRV